MKAPRWAICFLVGLAASTASAADLSPGHWPAATRAKLEQGDFYFFPAYPASVKGRSMLISATASPVAVHAGMETLRQGGTAADAAATVALTQVVQRLGSDISYAGVLKLIYFDAKTGKVSSLDGTWGTYAGETDPKTIPDTDLSAISGNPPPTGAGVGALGRQTLVPGFMAGIEAMHSRFGRLSLADLFQPAIWYAENGVTISPALGAYFRDRQGALRRTVEGRRFAAMPDGSLPKIGDLYKQPELARTLRAVASQGASYMYTGDWARAFVAAVNAEGGKATLADLQRYRAEWRDPISTSFAGARVYAPGGPADGSCTPLEALNMLSGLRVEGMGPYWRDPKAFVSYVHALRFAQYGHAAPVVTDLERQKGFASNCRSRLTPAYAEAFGPVIAAPEGPTTRETNSANPGHTESVVVVDRWGDVAVLVHSINCLTWGDTGIVVGGIPIGDAAATNKARLAEIRPGDRVPEAISPVIAIRGSKPVLGVASVGADNGSETARIVAGVLGSKGDLRSVMTAPPILGNWDAVRTGSLWSWPENTPRGGLDPTVKEGIQALGLPLKEVMVARVDATRGSAAVVVLDEPSGAPSAVVVPQVDVFAETDEPVVMETPSEVRVSTDLLDQYVGDYQVGPNYSIRLRREGDHLFSTSTGRPEIELFALGQDEFFEAVEDVQVTFRRDAQGHAASAVIHRLHGNDVVAVRKTSTNGQSPN